MWAQLVKARVRPGFEDQIRQMEQEFEQVGSAGNSPLRRIYTLRNENDPREYYTLVFFESEEAARANEQSPEQSERIGRLQQMYDGTPEYVDLIPVAEWSR